MDGPNRLLIAAEEVQQFCARRNWRFCFIGGIAVQHWGEARLTRDAALLELKGDTTALGRMEELLARHPIR